MGRICEWKKPGILLASSPHLRTQPTLTLPQVKESRISYSDSGISDEAELERAVVNRDYPPRISFEVLYAPVPPDNRRSKFVRLKISGSDEGLLEFLCEIYINHPPAMSNGEFGRHFQLQCVCN